jgi:hypothetical protein
MSDEADTHDQFAPEDVPVSEAETPEILDEELDGEEGVEGEEPNVEDDDSEDLEVDGEKYRVPKKLKAGFMMQADYTRKTQEVAESRRALEAREAEFHQQAKASQEHVQDLGMLAHADEQLKRYAQIDWNTLADNDPVEAIKRQNELRQWEAYRQNLAYKIDEREQTRSVEAQRTYATRQQEAQETITREIKGWGPELATKLDAYARTLGFTEKDTQEAVRNGTLPRIVKALHQSMLYETLVQKQQTAAKARPLAQTEQPKPLTRVNKGSGSPGARKPLSEMSMEEYAEARRAGRS